MTIKKSTLWIIVGLLLWFNFVLWSYKNPSVPNSTHPQCQALHTQQLRNQCEQAIIYKQGHGK